MIYCDSEYPEETLWWHLYANRPRSGYLEWPFYWLQIQDATLDALLHKTLTEAEDNANLFTYALAADYIEENWDRLLRIAETAAGVDPEPLLRRLLERLRTEWADYLNGGVK